MASPTRTAVPPAPVAPVARSLAPKPITKLPLSVVNKIAAGEIIQRPANALKELIENALDAGATNIRVTVKEGGTKLLQIQDNGSGIQKGDLAILCERFTTSKIKAYSDLTALGTYGFRGEALASISHVAHLSVTTKTREESVAWKATYSDGIMVPSKKDGDAEPVPCAGNDGTLIVVEDLFYNTPTRLKSLRSPSEEYSRILSVLLHYSIHNSGISFVCKKAGATTADVNTAIGASVLDNIGMGFGEALRRELVEVKCEDEAMGVKASGWFSGGNFGGKKGVFLFFINHRLVDCTPLKRAFEAFYGTLLSKGVHPFVYLSLDINPARVDVNVHPTKLEVGLEDEEEIVNLICEALGKKLEAASDSRTFKVQTLLPSLKKVQPAVTPAKSPPRFQHTLKGALITASTAVKKVAPNKLVRTDHHAQTLDTLFAIAPSTASKSDGESLLKRRKVEKEEKIAVIDAGGRIKLAQSECSLKSVKELRKEVISGRHEGLDSIVKQHIFVGVADLEGGLSMLQHQTKLYLVNHESIAEELMYQLALRQFGRLPRIKLSPAPSLRALVRLAVEADGGRSESKLSTEAIIDKICALLIGRREMLDEYFSFKIGDEGEIESLPLILPGYLPSLDKLPLFLVRIGVEVDWTDEKLCFSTFLRELAFFYIFTPLYRSSADDTTKDEARSTQIRQIRDLIFPTAKQYLVPPVRLLNKKDVVLATSLESLYKVFERC